MFKGQFKLIKKDLDGNVVFETDWLDNNVTLSHIQGRMHVNAPDASSRIGPNIVICEWDGPTDELVNDLWQPWAIGVDVVPPSFQGNPNTGTPYFEEYQQTFSPPTTFFLLAGQDETNYDGAGSNGTFVGGAGYAIGDSIEISSLARVVVDNVAAGVVTEFTVASRGVNGTTVGVTQTQTATDGGGAGFTLTPQANNASQTRLLNSIGVTNNSISGDAIEVDAWTALGATCTQSSVETLIVFYRIQFDAKTGNNFHTRRQNDVARFYGAQIENNTWPTETVHTWQANIHNMDAPVAGNPIPGQTGSGIIFPSGENSVWSTAAGFLEVGPDATHDSTYFAKRFTHSSTIAENQTIGQIRGTILYKNDTSANFGRSQWWNNLLPPGAGRVQNIYSHASGREATQIDFTGHTIVGGDHFLINSPADSYYVWYTVDAAGADPAPGGTGIQVDILSGDTDIQVAQKTQAVLAGELDFDCATTATAVIIVINHVGGAVTAASDSNTGAAFTQLLAGSNTFATVPFFDPLTVPTSTAVLAINSSGWTDPDYPYLYRVNITQGGGVGTATYNFQRRRQTAGFIGNNFIPESDAFIPLTQVNDFALGELDDNDATSAFPNNQADGGSSSDRGEIPGVYNDHTIFVCDNSKMSVINIITGELLLSVNSTDFPAWGATNIGQYVYDELDDTIWVACDQTGIYSVNDPLGSPTVSFHDVTGATYTGTLAGPTNQGLAIDVGRDLGGFREVWAIVNGGLVRSTDSGTSWTSYDGTSANGALVASQDETDYNGAVTDTDSSLTAGRGYFTGGTGYAISDTIVLSHDGGSVVTVDNVAAGVITEFTITTPTATTVPERIPLTQASTSGGGTGFELVPDHHNTDTIKFRNAFIGDSIRLGNDESLFDAGQADEGTFTGGTGYADNDKIVMSDGSVWNVQNESGSAVTQFDILKTGTQGVGGVTLTQVYTTGSGTGFTLTPSAVYGNEANLGHPDWRHIISMHVSKVETNARMFLRHYHGTRQSSTHKVIGSWWDTDLGYMDILGGHFPTSVNDYFQSVSSNGSGTGFTNQRRLWRKMSGVSPNDDRFATFSQSTTFSFARNNQPIWLTYRQGEAGIVSHDSGLANGGRSPALTFSEDPTVTGGSVSRNSNHIAFATNDSGEDFILFINEGETDLFALEQAGVATKLFELTSIPNITSRYNILSSQGSDAFVAYMGNGLFLFYNNTRTTFSSRENIAAVVPLMQQGGQPLGNFKVDGSSNAFENEMWESFGWNGATWVLGDDGVKTTHAGLETLIDGLTISFDDDSGADSFTITDYFTTGVVNGVQLDANTEYTWNGSMYLQPTDNVQVLEPAAVPGSTTLLNIPTDAPENRLLAHQDTTGNIVLTQGTATTGEAVFDDINKTGTAGVEGTRINQPSEGDFRLFVDHFSNTQPGVGDGSIFGVSNVTALGTALNRDTVQFGFYVSGNSTSTVDIFIRESGVNVAVVERGVFTGASGAFQQGLNMEIVRTGTQIDYYFMGKLVHTSASAFGATAVPEFIIGNGADARMVLRKWEHTWTDTFSYIGTAGGLDGRYDPNLRVVDILAQDYSLTINAVEGVTPVANGRDRATILAAGQYVVYPEYGVVRLAAADSGQALSGNFTVVQSD